MNSFGSEKELIIVYLSDVFMKNTLRFLVHVRRLGFFTIIGVGTLVSCERSQTDLKPSQEVHLITLKQAAVVADVPELAIPLQTHYSKVKASKSARLGAKVIANSLTLTKNGTPFLYAFNYANNSGFILISADNRVAPIVAWSDKGMFKSDGVPETNGLKLWINRTSTFFDNIRNGQLQADPNAASAWAVYQKSGATTNGTAPPPVDPPTGCEETVDEVNSLLATTWGQGCGYNDNTPSSSIMNNCYHDPTGCVATAMAQVMYYYQFPNSHNGTSYNWGSMPTGSGSSVTARLMSDLGVSVGMNYGPLESGALIGPVPTTFTNYGYSSSSINNYNYSDVVNQLRSRRPVILAGFDSNTGGGHMWVCDGYMIIQSSGCAISHWLSLNWGWDGNSNGWYTDFQPRNTGFNFNNGDQMVTVVR